MRKLPSGLLVLAMISNPFSFANAALLVTEPFDYTPGIYPANNWDGLSGSGIGWGPNGYSDHTTTNTCNFVIGDAGPSGAYFKSQGQNNFGNYWRNRSMSPVIHNNTQGSVTWHSMLSWSDGTNNGGGMIVHNPNGGTNYNIRLATGHVYELRGGHNDSQGTTDRDVSTLVASTNPSSPDFLLFKIENLSGTGMQRVDLWINPDVTVGATGLTEPDLSVSYQAFVNNRRIAGINFAPGEVNFDEILFGTTYKDVVSAIPPVPPYNPVPTDGGSDVSVTRTLRWGNADADSYQVFFWKSSESKPGTPTAITTEPLYDPEENLELNTNYSWQVIVIKGEVEAAGPVWTFKTGDPLPPGETSSPVPADETSEVVLLPTLHWGEASRATSYDVFLWQAGSPRPESATANVAAESYTPANPLTYGTTYRWQVEVVNEFGRNTESPIWEFTTELLVNTPTPGNGSTDMLAWQPLSWAAAPGVTSYDVFLWKSGSSKPATATANVATNQYFPNFYLDFGTAYSWQVVAQLAGGGSLAGPEWSFTTETEGQSVATPPFDISPSAQAARTLLYDTHGRGQLTGDGTRLTSGMKISFYGDSVTWQDGYMGRIRNALSASSHTSGLGVTLINHGVNGGGILTIRDGDPGEGSHFGGTEPQPFASTIASESPDVVVLFIGINDIWWRGTSASQFEQALRDIVAQANSGGVSHFVIATPWLRGEKPDGSNVNDTKIVAFSAICQQVAEDTGATFVNLHSLAMSYLQNNNFTLENDGTLTFRESGRLTYDQVHPSSAGNDFLADQLSLGIHTALAEQESEASIRVQADAVYLSDGSEIPVNFGTAPLGLSVSKVFTVTNGSTTDLTLSGVSKDGPNEASFLVTEPEVSILPPGNSTTFTVTFNPDSAGAKTTSVHLASDAPGDLSSFDIVLAGTALSSTIDTDGDGLNDAAEYALSAMGFDWQVNQTALVNVLFNGANSAGLYRLNQIHTLQVSTPQLKKDSATDEVRLTLSIRESDEMGSFTPLPMTNPQLSINENGEVELNFTPENNTSLYHIKGK